MATLMFRRLLIANRGEIACRIIRTARRLGILSIAVYSDADAGARHVRLADEAWHVGPAPARDSYLSIDRILEVARMAHAEAIHPGYGFLSERAEFAARCERAGVQFVGPPAAAMAAMGSKNAAKEAMRRAGVPVLPGYHGEAQTLDRLEAEALKVGFPLIVKPSGGGGGKGMQIVERAADLKQALAGARRLAESAFADPTLLIERYLPAPRHVEVQVLCDSHGQALHLHTRDCSVQRRHQKLIEEAPAPGIPDAVRARLHAAGLAVARAVSYVNAGTIEFLYADGEFWFMEMNTRLQVEHCVTEEILGLDLVEWQLRIAAGEALPFSQQVLVPRGHAIEARVCAEDPANDFAPSAGRLVHARWPEHVAGVRVDAGFEAGDSVSSHYDSLLGKVIGRGADRGEALAALSRGLQSLRIVGVTTNTGWLAQALEVPAFERGELSTRFLAEHGERLAAPVTPTAQELALGALAVVAIPDPAPPLQPSPWDARDAFRLNLPAAQCWVLRAGGADHSVEIVRQATGWRVRALGSEQHYEIATAGDGLDVVTGGVRRHLDIFRSGDRLSLWRGATRLDLEVVDPRHVEARASVHEGELVARLPGTVVAVPVTVGEAVAAGAALMVLEAMKMEHAVIAPRAGIVTRIHFAQGDRVPEGAVLVELSEAAPGGEAALPRD
ncbi:MAG TPA: biotin carboxylase N-terminal domain-containing protein [Steroidobacteraceae bacterium]|nr:biotin carboxylase N-terminal domain-containing protein [Steroidobacteraceae bacterium]